MVKSEPAAPGVGLSDALEALRAEFELARAKAAESDVQFPVESVTVELKVVATKEAGGKAGFRVPVIAAEVGGSGSRSSELTQTITVVLGGPVDREGTPQPVASRSDVDKD
jgi:Trypsin-co-occurring domain 2